jgi:hypothetical protein
MNLFDSFYDQEYLCGIVTGSHRKGKTLLLAFIAYTCYKKYSKIYANFKLNIPNTEILTSFDSNTLENIEEGSLVLITELHHYIDCRTSMQENQINLTQSLQEIGKTHSHFIGDIKLTSMLDTRMRDLFTFSIYAFGSRKRHGEKYKDIFKYGLYHDELLRFQLNYPEKTFYIDAKPVYPLYDTTEFITFIKEKEKESRPAYNKIGNYL